MIKKVFNNALGLNRLSLQSRNKVCNLEANLSNKMHRATKTKNITNISNLKKPNINKVPEITKKQIKSRGRSRVKLEYPICDALKNEILSLFQSRVSRYTHITINEAYRASMLKDFAVFDKFVAALDPLNLRNSLKCYTADHARKFKMEMDKEGQSSPFTGDKVSKGYLAGIAIHTRNIFTYAKEAGLIEINPFQNIPMPKYKSSQVSPDFFRDEIIDKLTHIDHILLEKMNIKDKYLYLLPRVMIRLGYEIAARSCEIVRMCIEDIQFDKKRNSGLIPVQIIGAKQRPPGHIDTVWVFGDKIEPLLNHWLKVRSEFLTKHHNEDIGLEVSRRKGIGKLLFLHPEKLTEIRNNTTYKGIFSQRLIESEIPKHLCGRTHLMRISRITNWVLDGWDFYDIHKNARHAKFEESERYTRGNSEDRATRIEKNLNLNKSTIIDNFTLPDEQKMTYILFKFMEMLKQSGANINDTSRIPSLVKNLYKHLTISPNNTDSTDYYTIKDIEKLWGLKNSQAWKRIHYLEKDNRIHLTKAANKQALIPKFEIDEFSNKYIELSRVSKLYGITSQGQLNYIVKVVKKGRVDAIKVSHLWFIEKTSLENWLNEKRGKENEKTIPPINPKV